MIGREYWATTANVDGLEIVEKRHRSTLAIGS